MRKSKLAYLMVALPLTFLSLYYKELVGFVNSVDPTIHPEHGVRCLAPGEYFGLPSNETINDRNSEVINVNGQLYCCHLPQVQCSTSITGMSIENYTYELEDPDPTVKYPDGVIWNSMPDVSENYFGDPFSELRSDGKLVTKDDNSGARIWRTDGSGVDDDEADYVFALSEDKTFVFVSKDTNPDNAIWSAKTIYKPPKDNTPITTTGTIYTDESTGAVISQPLGHSILLARNSSHGPKRIVAEQRYELEDAGIIFEQQRDGKLRIILASPTTNITAEQLDNEDFALRICTVDEFLIANTETYNTSYVYEPTPVTDDMAIKAPSATFLYVAIALIGLIAAISFVTNKKKCVSKTFNFGCFIAELVLVSMQLHDEALKVLLIGPYEAAGQSSTDGITKWKGLLLVLSVTTEILCDGFILCASTKRHLEGDFDKNTLEADGWNDETDIGVIGMFWFVVVQLGCGGAYMTASVFGCSDFTSSGGLAIAALVLSVLGCCCILCLFCSEGVRTSFFEGSGFIRKTLRLIITLFVTEIPGILLNPEVEGLATIFLTLLVYTSIEQLIDWFADAIFCCFEGGKDILDRADDLLDGASVDDGEVLGEDEEIGGDNDGGVGGNDEEEYNDGDDDNNMPSDDDDDDEREYNADDYEDNDDREYNADDYDDNDDREYNADDDYEDQEAAPTTREPDKESDLRSSRNADDGINPTPTLPRRGEDVD